VLPDNASGIDPATIDPSLVGGFSSRHHGGINCAFGDGSVRFVRNLIAPAIFRYLGHRADGEMISADQQY
jgi:prepilin-type processing-associated H-X9-DG protein